MRSPDAKPYERIPFAMLTSTRADGHRIAPGEWMGGVGQIRDDLAIMRLGVRIRHRTAVYVRRECLPGLNRCDALPGKPRHNIRKAYNDVAYRLGASIDRDRHGI